MFKVGDILRWDGGNVNRDGIETVRYLVLGRNGPAHTLIILNPPNDAFNYSPYEAWMDENHPDFALVDDVPPDIKLIAVKRLIDFSNGALKETLNV